MSVDQIGDAFSLGQIQFSVQKSAQSEFARLGGAINRSARAKLLGPERRTMAIAPGPGAVATAAIVSLLIDPTMGER